MKKFFFFFVFILILSNVYSLGIRGTVLRDEVIFQPGLSKTYNYALVTHAAGQNYEFYVISRAGDPKMADYITVSKDKVYLPQGGDYSFKAYLNLPESFETPGWHDIRVGARETEVAGGVVGAKAAIEATIKILVIFPYKYLDASLEATNVNKGEKSKFTIKVANYGNTDINNIYAKIDVYDNFGNFINSVNTNFLSLLKEETGVLSADFLASEVGYYKINATIYYDEKQTSTAGNFRAGEENLEIIDFSKTFFVGTINKVNVNVESAWTETIKDLYFIAKIYNGSKLLTSVRSQNFEILGFNRKVVDSFLDFTEIPIGNYTGEVEVFFGDNSKLKTQNIEVINPPEPIQEQPSVMMLFVKENGLLVGILMMNFLLILFLVGMFVKNNRKNKDD